jgi:predicted RNA methylase
MSNLSNNFFHPIKRVIRRRRDLKSLSAWNSVDQRRSEFYSQFVSSGDLVFDVGANVGNRSKIFSRLGARVIAFEPQPACRFCVADS